MQRILLPTLEGTDFKGGVARYIKAIVSTYPEVSVHTFARNVEYPEMFLTLWRTRNTFDGYLIHHILPIGTVAWVLSFFGLKPYTIFLHGMDFDLAKRNPWKIWLTTNILSRAKHIVVNSEALKDDVAPFVDKNKITVVYPTVEDQFVEISKTVRKGLWTNEAVNPSEGVMKLLTVGRLVERKGHLKVLELVERIPGITYHIVGDGPLRGKIEAEIMHRGLQDRVTITTDASDEDLPKMYRDADIFVMPTTRSETDREGFGIVYLEAQLFGLPVIATRSAGVSEAVEDGVGGMLIEDTPDALEATVKKLMTEPALRSRLGSEGRERVLAKFTREAQMKKLEEILK